MIYRFLRSQSWVVAFFCGPVIVQHCASRTSRSAIQRYETFWQLDRCPPCLCEETVWNVLHLRTKWSNNRFCVSVESSPTTAVLLSVEATVWRERSAATDWPWAVIRQGHVTRCCQVLQTAASLLLCNAAAPGAAVPKHRKGESVIIT